MKEVSFFQFFGKIKKFKAKLLITKFVEHIDSLEEERPICIIQLKGLTAYASNQENPKGDLLGPNCIGTLKSRSKGSNCLDLFYNL